MTEINSHVEKVMNEKRALNHVMAVGGEIDVHFHILKEEGASSPVTTQMIDDQMTVLNGAFASGSWSFKKSSVQEIANDKWADMEKEEEIKRALRKGDSRALNFYVAELSDVLGYAYYPSTYSSTNWWRDGVVVDAGTLPGGYYTNYNGGDTATHEVGHWLGLPHTFQGGCGGVGDSVDDTPEVASPNGGCPVGVDSCPNDGQGPDMVENFMDYTYDSCMDTFTAGQFARMQSQWTTYKESTVGKTCYSSVADNCYVPFTPTAAPTPASPTRAPVPVCYAEEKKVGDGKCDNNDVNNVAACSWDGGDCCEQSCLANTNDKIRKNCGKKGYNCIDPTFNVPTPAPVAVPTLPPVPTVAVCNAEEKKVGDGKCDNNDVNNVASCSWDGGDCCEQSCLANTNDKIRKNCGKKGYNCIDPTFNVPTPAPVTVPTLPPVPTTAVCNAKEKKVGDGKCDGNNVNNVAECQWDGGDCCEQSCLTNTNDKIRKNCGKKGYQCMDPTYAR
jgi:hypothetical protein